jgi:hypothetical protein
MKRGYTLYIEEDIIKELEPISKIKRRTPSSIVNELIENYCKEEKCSEKRKK